MRLKIEEGFECHGEGEGKLICLDQVQDNLFGHFEGKCGIETIGGGSRLVGMYGISTTTMELEG